MPKQAHNRVWIELEKPRDDAHAHEICEMTNRMLARLNAHAPISHGFDWDEKRKQFIYGNEMGYEVCSDRGQWFNLGHLGRPL